MTSGIIYSIRGQSPVFQATNFLEAHPDIDPEYENYPKDGQRHIIRYEVVSLEELGGRVEALAQLQKIAREGNPR